MLHNVRNELANIFWVNVLILRKFFLLFFIYRNIDLRQRIFSFLIFDNKFCIKLLFFKVI